MTTLHTTKVFKYNRVAEIESKITQKIKINEFQRTVRRAVVKTGNSMQVVEIS